MPRKARIDAPGALHHIIARGIGRRKIFLDDIDCDNFLERFGGIVSDSGTQCFAWTLIPNHFHLLLRTGNTPIATVMRRLLTGHAAFFNRRHRRAGHLFQNRYKSILCQADAYLLELVRYIHLNPLRARIVPDLKALETYPFVGHGAVLAKIDCPWQDTQFVLDQFADGNSFARRRYRTFIKKGVEQGRRPELTGGGLVRSAGGWTAIKELRKSGVYQKGDERILGDGDFVTKVLAQANEQMERKYQHRNRGLTIDVVVDLVADLLDMKAAEVRSAGKYQKQVKARSLVCFWAATEVGVRQAELSRYFGITQPAAGMAVKRGGKIAAEKGLEFVELIK